jgi:hypothetical protein
MSFGTQGHAFRLFFDKPKTRTLSKFERDMLRAWEKARSDPVIEARRREKPRINHTVRVTGGKKAKVTLPAVSFLGKAPES